MSIRATMFSSQIFQRPLRFPKDPSSLTLSLKNRGRTHLYCGRTSSSNSISDADLATDLAAETAKMRPLLLQRKEAMEKSREFLFGDFCKYLGLRVEDVKKRWREIGEEERSDLIRGFVDEWGVNFYPLSLRCVKEMVEEELVEDNSSSIANLPPLRFPSLSRIMRFTGGRKG